MVLLLNQASSDIADIYHRHAKTIYRVCFTYLKNPADTDDAVSETFVKLIKSSKTFENTEHEKAWLIRTSTNICKDFLKHKSRKNANIDDYTDQLFTEDSFIIDDVMKAILSLPNKYKTVVFLFYYQGYSCVEIANILGKPQATIRYHLQVARKKLKEKLGEDFNE